MSDMSIFVRKAAEVRDKGTPGLGADKEMVGMAGEWEFARFSGIMPNVEKLVGGDGGSDFTAAIMMDIDVHSARQAFYLIHPENKVTADIYVLAAYDDYSQTAELVGWHWGNVLKRTPVREFGHGIRNHWIPRDQLYSMGRLKRRLGVIRRAG